MKTRIRVISIALPIADTKVFFSIANSLWLDFPIQFSSTISGQPHPYNERQLKSGRDYHESDAA